MLSKKAQTIQKMFELGYDVLDNGTLVSPKGKKLKTFVQQHGKTVKYLQFSFRGVGIPLHRMIAYKKFGPVIFEKGVQVRHLDNNSFNNSINNLALGTNFDNTMDKPRSSRKRAADHLRKIETWQVIELIKQGKSKREISEVLGVHYRTICRHASSPPSNDIRQS